ncbi:hypothetical protein Rsub_11430 [Raphidocelis subcapitata]|uniref:GATA-type domain-containing protein n=1 Tax=Raphidocelis subcapitata TaxID=307507 RepID=A0A2V0PMB5_9CHLO|nr:hypothetical protein Rsub_11430 [Raphidocelis subcapitata]|eukprot:GBF99223.1 hypothetical protein Rsub_11430 [Raphidocelis subcapitata]
MDFLHAHGLDPAAEAAAIACAAQAGPLASLPLGGGVGASYLEMDGVFAPGCGFGSASSFLLPDELPSPLDGGRAAKPPAGGALLPPPGLLPLPDDAAALAAAARLGGAQLHPVPADPGSMYSDYTALCAGDGASGGVEAHQPALHVPQHFAHHHQHQQPLPLHQHRGQYHHHNQQQHHYQQQQYYYHQQQQQQQQQYAQQQQQQQQQRLYQLCLLSPETGQPMRTATNEDAEHLARLMESESSGLSTAAGPLPRALSFVVNSAGGVSRGAGAGGAEEGEGEEVGGRDQAASAKRQRTSKSGAAAPRAPPQQHRQRKDEAGAAPAAAAAAAAALRRAPPPKPVGDKRTGPCTHCGVEESPQWRKGPAGKPVLCNACGTRYRRTHQLGPAVPSSVYRQQAGSSGRRGA